MPNPRQAEERPFVQSLLDDIEEVLRQRTYLLNRELPSGYLWTNSLPITDLQTLRDQLHECLIVDEDFDGEADDLALFYMSLAHAMALTPDAS